MVSRASSRRRPAVLPLLPLLTAWAVMSASAQERIAVPVDSAVERPADGLFWRLPDTGAPFDWRTETPGIERHIDDIFEGMSDEERVAQLLLVGWNTAATNPEIMRWITERNIGGVKVFGWNGNNLATLAQTITEMQTASLATETAIPLFTATDQEGGWVRHVKGGTSITPGNMAIGASDLPYDALMTARYIGLELRALGINMNFAPTVDVYINPEAHVIGPRAFSGDAVQSGILGTAFFHGLEQTGVIATAKHFPGHGNAVGDSHGILPVIEDDFETLWNRDMVPFRMLIREGVPAVLSGHLSFPVIAGNDTPASISPYFKQRILRDELGFEGVVITDDLYMGGALEYGRVRGWSFAQIVKQAIEAGNDIVMLSQTPEFDGPIWNTLITAYREEPPFRRQVDESVRRILRIKLAYLTPSWRVPLFPDHRGIERFMRTAEAREFFLDQAGRSVTVIRDASIPFTPRDGERVLLAGKDPDFFRVGRRFFPAAGEFRFTDFFPHAAAAADRNRFARMADAYDTVIFLLSDQASLEVLQAARSTRANVIVYSILTPIYLADLPWVDSALAVYGWGVESFEGGFAALGGDIPAAGRLPIELSTPPDR
ncbi:MAG: glycoside hydrolase family 3 protein [Spirochaetales bacterium]|nr:glycoside hydrolase family 3 protein [Spirochaetales bacterium]